MSHIGRAAEFSESASHPERLFIQGIQQKAQGAFEAACTTFQTLLGLAPGHVWATREFQLCVDQFSPGWVPPSATVLDGSGETAAPITRFQVRYATDAARYNILPDNKGLFAGPPCPRDGAVLSECPYVDGENGFVIRAEKGVFVQVQQFDRDLRDAYKGILHYRHFVTDIQRQAVDQALCPALIDASTGWALGGSDNGEPWQKIRFSLWLDAWPEEEQPLLRVAADAYIPGMAVVRDEDGQKVLADFDGDGQREHLLDKISPGWRLAWDTSKHPQSTDLMVTLENGRYIVESPGQAMLLMRAPGGVGELQECGLVDARFRFVATRLP